MEATALVFATSLLSRLRGLLDPKICAQGEILVLPACSSIHTVGMRESIDVAFIDRRGRVLKTERRLRPGRHLSCAKAACTLERRSRDDRPWFGVGDELLACDRKGSDKR
ncbi:MAG: DUF192 domain-containing protein [Coriobacteriales bacterium]|nr:DUF192 domain-containing protein [Coriobacteriales bacterium]